MKFFFAVWRLRSSVYRACCSRRFASGVHNFSYNAGLSPHTSESDFKDRPLLITEVDKYLTYGNVNVRSGRMAKCLSTIYNIGKNDVIMCRTSKMHSVILYLATLRLGAIYVPLNPAYTVHEMEHFVQNAQPKLLVTCQRNVDTALDGLVNGPIVDEKLIAQQSSIVVASLDVEDVKEDDVAVILYTSGTTGKPKGVALSHGALLRNAKSLVCAWRFTSSDVLLHTLPFFHIHGMFLSFSCTLLSRSSTIFRQSFNAYDAVSFMPKCTVFSGVPSYYRRLLEVYKFDKESTRRIRLFICGSAPLSKSLYDQFLERTGRKLLQRFGMTEAMVLTSMPYEEEKRFSESVGQPLPGVELKIASDGVVEAKSESMFKEYWRDPDRTRADFTTDGFFRTGDLGHLDEDGFLYLYGRGKDMIISGGLNVFPKEVEDVVDAMGVVKECAVIGVPHPDFGEGVVAVCSVSEKQNYQESHNELRHRLESGVKERLASYKRPKKWIFLDDEIPRNTMGKVQKNVLRNRYQDLFK